MTEVTVGQAVQAILAKAAAVAPSASAADLAYLAKSIEAVAGNGTVAEVLAAGEQAIAALLATHHTHPIADVTGLATTISGLAAQGKQTIWVPAAAMVARTTNGPAIGRAESTTNKVMRKSLDFDPATTQYAQFSLPVPKSVNLAGAVTAVFEWTSASSSGNVVWGVQAQWQRDGDALDGAWGTAQTATDAYIGANVTHVSAETASMAPAGTAATGCRLLVQVYRDATNASDTLAVNASLLGIRLFVVTNASNDA